MEIHRRGDHGLAFLVARIEDAGDPIDTLVEALGDDAGEAHASRLHRVADW